MLLQPPVRIHARHRSQVCSHVSQHTLLSQWSHRSMKPVLSSRNWLIVPAVCLNCNYSGSHYIPCEHELAGCLQLSFACFASPVSRFAAIIDLTRTLNRKFSAPGATQAATRKILKSLFPFWLPSAFKVREHIMGRAGVNFQQERGQGQECTCLFRVNRQDMFPQVGLPPQLVCKQAHHIR